MCTWSSNISSAEDIIREEVIFVDSRKSIARGYIIISRARGRLMTVREGAKESLGIYSILCTIPLPRINIQYVDKAEMGRLVCNTLTA